MAAAGVFMDSAGFLALWDAGDAHDGEAVRLQETLVLRLIPLNPMNIHYLFEVIVTGIELVAVAIIAIGLIGAFALGVRDLLARKPANEVYEGIRRNFGRVLLLGLEVLIAADIVETVTVDLTLTSVSTLGLLVLVRTFLSWSIEMETTGHWPWQPPPRDQTSHRAPKRP